MLSATKLTIAPEPSYATIKWLNNGGTGTWPNTTGTWTHNIPAEANCLVVALLTHNNAGMAIGPVTGYVGTTAYPLKLASVSADYKPAGASGYLYLLYCMNPPKGLVTLSITHPSSYTAVTSMAYSGVGSVAPLKGTIGTGTAPSYLASAPAGQMVVGAIGSYNDTPGPVNFTQTQRVFVAQQSAVNINLLVGDAMSSGTAPLTFGATLSSSQNWGVIAARLVPASVTPPSPTRATMEFWGVGGITSAWTENHFWVPTTSDSIVAEGEWLRNPYDQPVSITGSMDFSGTAGTGAKGDYGPYTGVGVFERGDTVNPNGLNNAYTLIQGPGAGTVTYTYTGFVEANRWFTTKIFESNVGGYGIFYHGTLSIIPLGTAAGW